MKILLNNEPVILEKESTVTELLLHQKINSQGIALAVNNKVIPKSLWESTILQENDQIIVIVATFGG